MSPSQEKCKCFLFVEGKDDVHVISKLLNKHKMSDLRDDKDKRINPLKLWLLNDNNEKSPLDIHPCEGENDNKDDNVTTTLERFKASIINAKSNAVIIGLVLDNDKGKNREAQVKGIIDRAKKERKEKANIDLCWKLEQDNKILTSGGFVADPNNDVTPRIGWWLMPDNQNKGMLETFLAKLVSNHDLFGYATTVAKEAKNTPYNAPYKECHEDKAIMHTYLAWQDEPGKPFGLAFEQGSFDCHDTLAVSFVDWIKELFCPRTSPCQHPEL